ncbi:LysR family transcriptional regulator, partial [Burkholderia multivorans]|uniref:LysR family transcriptional regulator n=1 Tax=Burkholderia multivorans TaxID=87883 RepID=UPI002B240C64
MNYRRLTPSMSLLLVFEAAARHESYTRAADELSLSQSAISRQIQTLEDQLGVPLFRREGRSVKLTDVGRRYFAEVGGALGRIRGATLQAMSHQAGAGTHGLNQVRRQFEARADPHLSVVEPVVRKPFRPCVLIARHA